MSANTNIEWADSTWSPWRGCTRISPGCDRCYAAALSKRVGGPAYESGAPRQRTTPQYWRQPVKWNAQPFMQCTECGWRGERREARADAMMLLCPGCSLSTLAPARQRVFCASLADVFDNEVDPQWRVDLFRLIQETPNLDWLVLTKRIGNAGAMITAARDALTPPLPKNWPFPQEARRLMRNLWLGATITSQLEADRDIVKLLAVEAVIHFISYEPALESMRPTRLNIGRDTILHRTPGWGLDARQENLDAFRVGRPARIDWVIAGGESGPGARPANPRWFRELRDDCAGENVPFFLKQFGEWAPRENHPPSLPSSKRAPEEREFVETGSDGWNRRGATVIRIGVAAAGRTLDGCIHNAFPEVRYA